MILGIKSNRNIAMLVNNIDFKDISTFRMADNTLLDAPVHDLSFVVQEEKGLTDI